jgi:hypothetical protein
MKIEFGAFAVNGSGRQRKQVEPINRGWKRFDLSLGCFLAGFFAKLSVDPEADLSRASSPRAGPVARRADQSALRCGVGDDRRRLISFGEPSVSSSTRPVLGG